MEEQIALLRALWADPVVTFEGRWHRVDRAGLNPLPPRRSIPIWIGGAAEQALERAGRLADGWFPLLRAEEARPAIARVRAAAERAGRDPATIGIEGRVSLRAGAEAALEQARRWIEAGATHLTAVTTGAGFDSPAAHIEAIEAFRDAWDSSDIAKGAP
jgi:alkanesulfonate monooxygenase SsuD/methylene tetrahydromethanopterin reductase-like flavin-dependent oxidoreductase (luciferase family)